MGQQLESLEDVCVSFSIRIFLYGKFSVEFLDAADAKILKVVTIPIHLESSKSRLDYVRVFYMGYTDIPFQSVGLGGTGKVGRTDVSGTEARVSFENI